MVEFEGNILYIGYNTEITLGEKPVGTNFKVTIGDFKEGEELPEFLDKLIEIQENGVKVRVVITPA